MGNRLRRNTAVPRMIAGCPIGDAEEADAAGRTVPPFRNDVGPAFKGTRARRIARREDRQPP